MIFLISCLIVTCFLILNYIHIDKRYTDLFLRNMQLYFNMLQYAFNLFWATQTLEISSIRTQKGLKGIWTINHTTFEASTTMHFVWYSLICPRIGMVWYLQSYMWKVLINLFPGRCIEFHNLYIHHKKYHFDIRRTSCIYHLNI